MEVRPAGPATRGPENWFTGEVWVDTIAAGHGPARLASVHFSPGARTAWHAHTIGQTLHVTEGEGRVQSRGGPIVSIQPGDVVHIRGDEWHWHGAAPQSSMTHLAFTEGETEWGQHVTGAEYDDSRTV